MKQENNTAEQAKFENPVFEQILKIIDSKITAGEIQALEKKLGFKKTILKIIEKDKSNKDLAIFLISEISADYFTIFKEFQNDKKISKIAIIKKSSMFYYASAELKKDKEFGFIALESMIREGKKYIEIESFIEQYFQKQKKEFFTRYRELLEKSEYIFSLDITRQILILKETNKELYDLIFKTGFVSKNSKTLMINKSFVTNILKELSKDREYIILDENQKTKYKINKIESIFNIEFKKLTPDEKYLFDSLLNLLSLNESKQLLSEKNIEKENEKQIENNDELDNNKKTENNEKEQEFKELLEYSNPYSKYYFTDGGINIDIINGNKIFITNEEKDRFTSKSLENFIRFYNTLYNLGIIFLWEKYKSDFTILCNNKFGFDYTRGEGITESKTLGVLNMIAKNVGIPEKTFLVDIYNENGELQENKKKEKIIGCYKTIGDAKLAFIEIKETGNINGETYSDKSAFGNGAIENKLIEVFCIDQKGNGLNISKWK